jgi:DNA-binding transcriptional regulator YiaG
MTPAELKTIRSDTGKSREKFARKLGVSTVTLQFWEEERNPIPEWGSNLINLTFPKSS